MEDQIEIHKLVQSKDVEERKRAAVKLTFNFAFLNDKEHAWDDLHRLTQDDDFSVRMNAAHAFGSYSYIPDEYKKQAWDDLIGLAQSNNYVMQWGAVHALGSCYSHIPDEYKKQAWSRQQNGSSDQCFLVQEAQF